MTSKQCLKVSPDKVITLDRFFKPTTNNLWAYVHNLNHFPPNWSPAQTTIMSPPLPLLWKPKQAITIFCTDYFAVVYPAILHLTHIQYSLCGIATIIRHTKCQVFILPCHHTHVKYWQFYPWPNDQGSESLDSNKKMTSMKYSSISMGVCKLSQCKHMEG